MQWTAQLSAFLALAATATAVDTATVVASEKADLILVRSTDGRVLMGEVDQHTDEESLWIRVTSPTIVLSTAVPWEQLAWAQVGNQRFSPSEFRSVAKRIATPLSKHFFDPPQDYTHPAPLDSEGPRNGRVYVVPARRAKRTAQSLTVIAYAANWDADAELDGIEVTIYPKSSAGDLIRLDGQLQLELIGTRYRTTRRLPPTTQLGQWSLRVRSTDFTRSGATYRVPFRSFSPERDQTIARDAELDAQLVGGRTGTLKAQTSVRLR